jgi:hypothetical protein
MKLSVEVYIKKNTLVIGGRFTNDNTSPFLGVSTDLTMVADEYIGFYIKVTSGDSAGLVSWITGNDTTKIDLETGIQIFNGDYFEIYKSEYKRLDLFNDEKISVTSQIGNGNDIGKLYTDFSQSFTIPASKNNNEILSHWYESSVDNGFDHRMRYDAYIEVNTQRFKNGSIQLEKADKKNGFIESYSVTFYGNLTQLKDVFKDEKLQILDYSQFNHTYNSSQIINRIQTSIPYDVKYPLIGNTFKYAYQLGGGTDITLSTGAIKWNDLFPAIPIQKIFLLIQARYGINFIGSFFNLDQWTKLHLYLKQSTNMIYSSVPQQINWATTRTGAGWMPIPELNFSNDILTTNWNFGSSFPNEVVTKYYVLRVNIVPNSASQTIPYTLYSYKDGVLFSTIENTGTQSLFIDEVRISEDPTPNHTYTFALAVSSITFTYTAELYYRRFQFQFGTSGGGQWLPSNSMAYSNSTTPTSVIDIGRYIPDIKIVDFITGIIKAFNLMIIPRANNTYEFIPLELYYNAGKILDLTEYVYEDEMTISKPKLFKSINFSYAESNNILNQAYKSIYQQNYGDLIYNSERITESATYEIKLPFENVLFEVPKQGTKFQTATLIDKNSQPYIPKPMLIYCNGRLTTDLTGADRIYITQSSGSPIQMTNYQRFSNEYDSLPNDPNHSGLMTMNFGNEQSSWLNELAPRGLYFRHYRNYIENLYNIKTRMIKAKALLPASLLGSSVTNAFGTPLGIALNDRLVIRNKRYIINSFTSDLTTGETDLELLTDYRGVNAVSTIGYRFSSFQNIETDKAELILDIEIYLNDYESFGIKGSIDFLVYTASTNNTNDTILTLTIPENTTGLDRSSFIPIGYYLNGVEVHEENLIVTQTG